MLPHPFFTAKTKNNFAQILGSLKSYGLPNFSLAPKPPFLAAVRQRVIPCDAPIALRGADKRRQSEAIADAKEQGWAGRCGGSLPARANDHPHAMNAWQRLSIYNGGAQDSINTGRNHRRRNRSPAWLLAQRSVERSRR